MKVVILLKKIIIFIILIVSILTLTGCTKETITKTDEKEKEEKKLVEKEFTRTYNIRHIDGSNNYDYLYITIREFQGEEIETVKVKRDLFNDAKIEDNYEITFKITSNEIEDNFKSIFSNSDIIKAIKTDKTGLEQVHEKFID